MARFNYKPKLNEKQMFIARSRYLKRTKENDPAETIQEMFIRISKFIASAEKKYNTPAKKIRELEEQFFEMQAKFEFLSGMALSDQGRNKFMAACYVLPLDDSLEGIYKTLYQSVQLHRLGAGIGYDFSVIRPEGSLVHSTKKEASGPISFMRLFDFSSEVILNRGSTRHAGHMGILRIDHPDIEKFISAKEDYSQLTNFNLSVAITDTFIKAYKANDEFSLINPQDNTVAKKVSAHDLLYKIALSMHKSAEPGVVFIDEVNRKHPLKKIATITATNLCGEQPLLPYESCNLGSVVLSSFVKDKNKRTFATVIDKKRLEQVVRLAVRFLDNTIDLSYYALQESKKIVTEMNRKIGLGVMGWADLLAQLEIPYDSDDAVQLAHDLMKFVNKIGHDESQKIGKEKGNFKNFSKSTYPSKKIKHMRNATVTTIAPTGTISLFANCNGGIEPFYALAFIRKNMETLGDTEMVFVNEVLEEKLKNEWLYTKKLMKKIIAKGSMADIKKIPKKIKEIFKTTYDIQPMDHIKMQAAFQENTDNAVSKTINLPENTTIDQIAELIIAGFENKLKGFTVYRDKSRDQQVLNTKK